VDITSGLVADPLDISYQEAKHGLCKKYGKPVFKKRVDDGFPPLVLLAREKPKPFRYQRAISALFINGDKQRTSWLFSPYELEEFAHGMELGLSPRQLAVRISAPLEAIEHLLEKIGGDECNNGTKRGKAVRGRAFGRGAVANRGKDARGGRVCTTES